MERFGVPHGASVIGLHNTIAEIDRHGGIHKVRGVRLMSDLRAVPGLDHRHSKRPRNFKVLETADRKLEGYNPLCGDKVTVFLELGMIV
jgi:hypothetical protein